MASQTVDNITRVIEQGVLTSVHVSERFNIRHNDLMLSLTRAFVRHQVVFDRLGISQKDLLALDTYNAGAGTAYRKVYVFDTFISTMLLSHIDPWIAATVAMEWAMQDVSKRPNLSPIDRLAAAKYRSVELMDTYKDAFPSVQQQLEELTKQSNGRLVMVNQLTDELTKVAADLEARVDLSNDVALTLNDLRAQLEDIDVDTLSLRQARDLVYILRSGIFEAVNLSTQRIGFDI
jgi:hypothetical protein